MTAIRSAIVQTIDTPDGPFTLIADEHEQVLASGWSTDRERVLHRIHRGIRPITVSEGRTQAAEAVAAYYAGHPEALASVPVLQRGTELQRRGWSVLREVSPGEPVSYGDLARLIGNAGAVRAAASICARNAPALFVPCHRVLRADGTLGGFAWGTAVKQALLDRESRRR